MQRRLSDLVKEAWLVVVFEDSPYATESSYVFRHASVAMKYFLDMQNDYKRVELYKLTNYEYPDPITVWEKE